MDRNHHENIAFEGDNLSEKHKATGTEDELEKHNVITTVSSRLDVDDEYVMYKRRWFGMLAIFTLNLSTGLVWLTFNAVPDISAEWLNSSKTHVNLSVILYFIAYIIMSSVSGLIFEKWGIKKAKFTLLQLLKLILGGFINLVGTAIRYFASFISSSEDNFQPRLAVILLGQFVAASAQPFFLNAPPKYAAIWFSESSRATGTTIGSISNPFAAAVAMIVIPTICGRSSDMPFTLLFCAIVAVVAVVPAIFMPSLPPTPPSGSAAMALADVADEPFWTSIKKISKNFPFWILFTVFSIYVAFFNAFSSLINQIVIPYGYTDDEAGIFGASLIVSGIIGAGISGAVVDKTKKYHLVLRVCTPLLGLAYVGFIFAVRRDFIAGIGAVCCIIGLLSFALLPVALELGIECTYPTASSASTSLLWMGGQTFAVIFLIVGDELRDESPNADPPENMKTALICMGVVSCVASTLAFLYNSPNYRLEAERRQRERNVDAS